ncbi:MAG: ATP-binding cassette domain-containing protein [Planctomycetota bacterium]|jgi:ATPase subunit of ABC transporter with duplicated ATPase domains
MSLVSFHKVAKAYAGTAVLDGVSFELSRRARVGLVGENGSGKSTILKLIASAVEPDAGQVRTARSARIAYVPQNPELDSERTAFQETLAARPALLALRDRIKSLEGEIDSAGDAEDSMGCAYGEVVAEFSEAGGYELERGAQATLSALGLSPEQTALPLAQLSGGERARVALAKAMLAEPDLLLLDEPDNHLDIKGIEWLEETLRRFPGAILLVTHDRALLERVADSILEMEDGKTTFQRGSYAAFLERKREKIERQMRQYLDQQRRVRKLKAAINKADGQARGVENRTIHFHYRKQASKIARRAESKRASSASLRARRRSRSPAPSATLSGWTWRRSGGTHARCCDWQASQRHSATARCSPALTSTCPAASAWPSSGPTARGKRR